MYEKNDAFYKEAKIKAYYVVLHEAKFSLRYYLSTYFLSFEHIYNATQICEKNWRLQDVRTYSIKTKMQEPWYCKVHGLWRTVHGP